MMTEISDEAIARIGNVLVDSRFENTILSTVSISSVEAPTSQSGSDIRIQLKDHIQYKKQLQVKNHIENKEFSYNGVRYTVEISPRYEFAEKRVQFGFIPLIVKNV